MLSMIAPDYSKLLDDIFSRMMEIFRQRSDLDAESAKLTQLMHATVNMLPDDQRSAVIEKWSATFATQLGKELSLSDAVRKVVQDAGREWLTVTQVRNQLLQNGFDFSGYMSNPLASVSATLIRMKEKKEVEMNTVEGVAAYRYKGSRMAAAFGERRGGLTPPPKASDAFFGFDVSRKK